MIPTAASTIFLILAPPVFEDYFGAVHGPLSLGRPRKEKDVFAAFSRLIRENWSFIKFEDESPNVRRSKMA